MRVHNPVCLAAIMAAAVASCASNPKPHPPTLEMMERKGWGGQVVVNTRSGAIVNGELIAIDASRIYVLRRPLRTGALATVDLSNVDSAKLYRYEPDSGFGGWGIAGALSTLTHGFWLLISAPTWLVSAAVAREFEVSHAILSYPKVGWSAFTPWARFPQGLPPNVDESDLIDHRLQQAEQPPRAVPTQEPSSPMIPPRTPPRSATETPPQT